MSDLQSANLSQLGLSTAAGDGAAKVVVEQLQGATVTRDFGALAIALGHIIDRSRLADGAKPSRSQASRLIRALQSAQAAFHPVMVTESERLLLTNGLNGAETLLRSWAGRSPKYRAPSPVSAIATDWALALQLQLLVWAVLSRVVQRQREEQFGRELLFEQMLRGDGSSHQPSESTDQIKQ